MVAELRRSLDWGKLVPLRLKARELADGLFTGPHRSARRGAGVEFGGHRPYVPGDDLRWLDRHALMRHGRLLVREFETETDRTLWLVLDASRSMGFRGPEAPAAKLAFTCLIAAALGRVALSAGDAVGLAWLGGKDATWMPPMGGRDAFERLVAALETIEADGDLTSAPHAPAEVFEHVSRSARRGSVIVLFSDLLDVPETTLESFAPLGAQRRVTLAVQVLDPMEARFPVDGPVRFRALEGDTVLETDAPTARSGYLQNLAALRARWNDRLVAHHGQLITSVTDEDPLKTVISVLEAAAGGAA